VAYGEWKHSSAILHLGTSWTKVIRFMHWPLYPRGPGPCKNCVGSWVGLRTDTDAMGKKILLPLLEIESQYVDPFCSIVANEYRI
jgi:hypothetical protein